MSESAAPLAVPAESPSPHPAPRRRIRGLLKLALLASLLYMVGGFWLTPWLARQAIEHYGSAALERSVQVAAVRFDPFTATFTADDVRVGERADGAGNAADSAALSVARVRIDLEPLALASGQVVLRTLDIDQPVLRIARDADGTLNWGDLWPRPPATGGGPTVVVQDVRLRSGRVRWRDGDAAAIEIRDIELDLPALDRLQRGDMSERTPRLAARIGDQQLAVQGEPHGESVRFALALDDVDLAPWVQATRSGDAHWQGQLDARLALDFATAARFDEHLALSGTLTLHDVALHSADARLDLSARSASLTLGDSHPLQHRWHVQALALDAPQVRYVVERSHAVAAAASPASPGTPAPVADAAPAPMQLRIDAATIRDGRFEYVLDEQRQLVLRALDADWRQAADAAQGELRAATQDEHGARLSAHATLDLALRDAIVGEATLSALAVPRYAAWLAPLAPGGEFAQGRLAAMTQWRVQRGTEGWQWAVSGGEATLADAELRLRERAAPPLLRLSSLAVGEVAIDSAARTVRLGSVRATAPRWAVRRTAAGFDFAALRPPAAKGTAPAQGTSSTAAPASGTAWQVKTGSIRIADGEIDLDDRRSKPAQRSRLQGIALNVADVTALADWWRKVSGER